MFENARRRWPAVRIRVRHALVQGPSAAEQLMAALAELDRQPEVEVIVVARGGGSLEDLLPFSDEGLVRAVYACRTPVVSAIGHETDTPLLDLVADHRASTPTDAAKRVVPDVAEEAARLAQARYRLRIATGAGIQRQRDWLTALRSRPVLADPTASFAVRRNEVSGLRFRAERAVTVRLAHESSAVEHTLARVRAVSPKATLERGYAILVADDGGGVTSVARCQTRRTVGGIPGRRPTARHGHRGHSGGRLVNEPGPETQPSERSIEQLSYEQAREELIRVVQQLESGGTPLAESLALWERGERLAALCQDWLDGAQAKIDAARQPTGEQNADPGST